MSRLGSDLTYKVGQLLSIIDLGHDWPLLLVKQPFFPQISPKIRRLTPPLKRPKFQKWMK